MVNTLEALFGAIYLDKGLKNIDKILHKLLFPYIDEIVECDLHRDPKSYLQELAQERKGITPHFKVLKSEGPDHRKVFTVGAFLGGDCVAKGKGSSKQKASVDSAKNALKALRWE